MEGIGYENYTQGNYYQQSRTEPQYGAESWHLVTFLNPKLEKLTMFLHTLSHSFVWQFCFIFETGSQSFDQAGLELTAVRLLLLHECWR